MLLLILTAISALVMRPAKTTSLTCLSVFEEVYHRYLIQPYLIGDVVSFNLDEYGVGSNRRYEVKMKEGIPPEALYIKKKLFNTDQSVTELPYEGCNSKVQLKFGFDIVLLCDETVLLRLNLDYPKMKYNILGKIRIGDEDISSRCFSLSMNNDTEVIDVLCESRDKDVRLFRFYENLTDWYSTPELVSSSYGEYSAANTDPEFVYTKIGAASVIIINTPQVPVLQFSFRAYRIDQENYQLLDLEEYSLENQRIDLPVDKQRIVRKLIAFNKNTLLIITADPDDHYIHECRFTRDYSTLQCLNETTNIWYPGTEQFLTAAKNQRSDIDIYFFHNQIFDAGEFQQDGNFYWNRRFEEATPDKNFTHIFYSSQISEVVYYFGSTKGNPNAGDLTIVFNSEDSSYEYIPWKGDRSGFAYLVHSYTDGYHTIYFEIEGSRLTTYELQPTIAILDTSLLPSGGSFGLEFTCRSDGLNGELTDHTTLNVSVLQDPNEEMKIKIPKLAAYVRTMKLWIPSTSDNIMANAPIVSLASPDPEIELIDGSLSKKKLLWDNIELRGTINFRGLNENLVSIWNETAIQFIYCTFEIFEDLVHCEKSKFPLLNITKERVLDIFLISDRIIAAIKVCDEDELGVCFLRLRKLNYLGIETEPKDYRQVSPNLAKFLVYNEIVMLQIVGSSIGSDMFSLFYTQIQVAEDVHWHEITEYKKISKNLCPIKLSSVYRSKFSFYVISQCHGDIRMMIYSVNFYLLDVQQSFSGGIFTYPATSRFMVCSTNSSINIIDKQRHKIISIYASQEDTVFSLPFNQYNLTKIIDCMCDQRRDLIQVLGSDDSGEVKMLINYRNDRTSSVLTRVHSIVKLESWAQGISKIINYSDDFIMCLVLDKTAERHEIIRIQTSVPLLSLSLTNALQPKQKNVTLNFEVPGRTPKFYQHTFEMNLQDFDNKFSIVLRKDHAKTKIMTDLAIELESRCQITGTYLQASCSNNNNYEVIDRIPLIPEFLGKNVSYFDSCSQLNFVLAYVVDELGLDTAYLFDLDKKELVKNFTAKDITSISCRLKMKTDEKGNSKPQPYFFLMVTDEKNMNSVLAIYQDSRKNSTSKGETTQQWRLVSSSLYIDGYDRAVFEDGPRDTFVVAAYASKYGFNLIIRVLWLGEDGELYSNQDYSRINRKIISHIDILTVNSEIFALYSEEYEMEFRVVYLKLAANNSFIENHYATFMMSKYIPSMYTNDRFDCGGIKSTGLKGSISLRCVFLDQQIYSYLVFIDVLISEEFKKTMTLNLSVKQLLINVPNLVPMFVQLQNEFIVVESFNATASNLDRPYHDGEMALIFYKGAASKIALPFHAFLYPYKIITSNSKTLPKDRFNFTDLSAYFFFDNSSKLMVHVNLMNSPEPFIRFKTTPLSLKITNMNNIPPESNITFTLMNGSSLDNLLGDFIDLDSLNPNRSMIEEKKHMLLIICFAGVLMIVLSISLLSCVGDKKQKLDIIEAIENTEYSIFPNDK